jgi:uncharacterized protein YbjT (DUF2867 family)
VTQSLTVVAGFGFTGQHATRRLLAAGHAVRTLTFHPGRAHPFGEQVPAFRYDFGQPEKLRADLQGAEVLVNTYWVRFPRGSTTFETAVHNTRILLEAARQAGIRRIVHASIAHASLDSPLGYYRGKAQVEEAVRASGLSYAILRPTVIFGREDILINNIAWFLRHFPVFGIPGNGQYWVQPIYAGDMGRLLAEAVERTDDYVLDAVGPELFTFERLVEIIAAAIQHPARMRYLPPRLAYLVTRVAGWGLRDAVPTWQEYRALMDNLLVTDSEATGNTRLSQWLRNNHEYLGAGYASEVRRGA